MGWSILLLSEGQMEVEATALAIQTFNIISEAESDQSAFSDMVAKHYLRFKSVFVFGKLWFRL